MPRVPAPQKAVLGLKLINLSSTLVVPPECPCYVHRASRGVGASLEAMVTTYLVDLPHARPEKEEGMNFEDVDKKGDEVLDFLQATQEIYFSDKRSKCEAPSMSSESIYESLQNLESHSMAASDVTLLHRMKSLVLLQDVERLKSATEEFQMHSAVPPGVFA
uniref:Uncharacterized protein n=1 Tax=Sphaerodactylus townsendi TaxID=933632 RepID=A0ACB8GE10_9SAUR